MRASLLLSSSLLTTVLAAPVSSTSGGNDLPPGSSGDLRGTEALLGNDGNPIDLSDKGTVANPELVPVQNEDADLGLYIDFTNTDRPQPIRGDRGGTDPGPDTSRYDKINSDLFAGPTSDTGDTPNLKWPMGLSHNHLGLEKSGWARQQNIDVLPAATAMAGVDMHLEPNAYRELHWHSAGEWSYIMNGSVRVAAMNENGENFVDDLNAGDVWFFPPGVPHSLQAGPEGTEFLLVFDEGSFSEEGTSLITEMFLRNPKSVMAKTLRTDVSKFTDLPKDELYIFPGTAFPKDIQEQNVTGPAGYSSEESFTYHLSQQKPFEVEGGSIKILDPETFPIASNFSAALVTIKPGAMREVHWHLTSDEWNFFIQGSGRITTFVAPASSRTFDYQAGDVGYIPITDSHYIENVGDEDLIMLEVLQAPRFTDISVAQWLGLTPKQVLKDTLNLPDDVLDNLPKYKQYIAPGDTNLTQTNFTRPF